MESAFKKGLVTVFEKWFYFLQISFIAINWEVENQSKFVFTKQLSRLKKTETDCYILNFNFQIVIDLMAKLFSDLSTFHFSTHSWTIVTEQAQLWSRRALVPQVTNFCLYVTGLRNSWFGIFWLLTASVRLGWTFLYLCTPWPWLAVIVGMHYIKVCFNWNKGLKDNVRIRCVWCKESK